MLSLIRYQPEFVASGASKPHSPYLLANHMAMQSGERKEKIITALRQPTHVKYIGQFALVAGKEDCQDE